ncbi:MAG: tetratricopeptide repeat protein, partial [Actinomycetota bacterium]|nr:tetratricopeptide repeat protein [Actinomycetota bacterium]
LLLILDNCEHVVDAAADLADELLSSCPNLKIFATSREPLGTPGEINWRVPPLSVPETKEESTTEDLMRYEAVRLFVERARQRLPTFSLTRETAPPVAEVCRRLEGIPLAIELATARMTALAVEQVAQRLEDSLSLLAAGLRTAPARQRTMRATLDWSYGLLSEPEKRLFARLSVFAGGWTLEAAEAVGEGEGIGKGEVLNLLSSLVDKSLVVAEAGPAGGVSRYRMLEPIRQYGRERLEEIGEPEQTRRRHATFFVAFAEEAEPELRGAQQATWLERLEREHDDFRAALSWTVEAGEGELGLRLAGALGDFWHAHGHLNEGRRWLEGVLAAGEAARGTARAKALGHAGYLAWEQIDYERATALSEEGLALSRESGNRADIAAALYVLGVVAMFQTRFEDASTLLEEALALWRELDDTSYVARTLQGLGLVAVARQDHERAMAIHEESLALARQARDGLGVILALGQGALAAVGRGEHELAENLCAEGLEMARRQRHLHAVVFSLNVWSVLAAAQGRPGRAARTWGAAAELGRTIGLTGPSPVERYHYDPYISSARAELGEAAWEAALAEGRTMELEEAVAYALSASQALPAPGPEGVSGGGEVLESGAEGSLTKAKALDKAGYLALFQGEYEAARALFDEALVLFRVLGDEEGTASALTHLGLVAVFSQRDLDTVEPLLHEATRLRPKIEDRRTVAMMLVLSGLFAGSRGDLEGLEATHREALVLFRETRDLNGVSMCISNLGLAALVRSDFAGAEELLKENLRVARRLDYKVSMHYSFLGLGSAASRQGRPIRAARLWGVAEAVRESSGLRLTTLARTRLDYDRDLAASRSQLGEAAWETAWVEGKTMAQEGALEYALDEEVLSATPRSPETPPGGIPSARLTRREREIMALVARGLTTDQQISAELFISKRTVETHVRNILKKYGLRSRAQLAARAADGSIPDHRD